LTIHATNNRYINDGKLAQGVGQMLARLGIDVTVETQPVTGYYGRARKKEMSMFMVGWGSTSGEASKVMRPALTSGSINNYGGYENAEFNRLFTQASQTLDTEERNALLGEAMAIAMDEVAIIPTHFQVNIWASRKGFQVVPRTDELTLPTYIKSSK
jgi:peptide/nickel transport system substrate-binding protein